jgi:hypothetical protein
MVDSTSGAQTCNEASLIDVGVTNQDEPITEFLGAHPML